MFGVTPSFAIQPLQVTIRQPSSYIAPNVSIAPGVLINPVVVPIATTPWYKSWWGVGGLVLGGTLALGAVISLVRR